MGTPLDRERIDAVVRAIGDRLEGRWLLVGGAAIAMWLEPRRVTEDIDVVPMTRGGTERYALMDLVDQLGLPIEAVNSAADFFVQRIPGWDDEVELLYRGPRSNVFRPRATLMLLMKVGRLSARDLADCELVLGSGEAIDAPRVLGTLERLPHTDDTGLSARRAQLEKLLRAL